MAMLIDHEVELRDLVDGTTRSWPAPGDPLRSNGSIQSLLSFSTDETELLAWVWGRTHGWAALIDLSSGDLVRARVNAHPIGLTDNGDVVTLRASDDALTVVVLDHALSEVRRFRLAPTDGWTAEPRERGTLTPAGELLVLDGDRDRLTLRRFSLADGIETSQVVADLDSRAVGSSCSLAWRGDDPVVVAKTTGSQARALQVHADGSTTQLVAVHHRMQSNCVTFVADALQSGPSSAFLGANDAVWTWYWRPLLLVLLLAGGALAWLYSRRRRPPPA
jgi:hypothetical protein